MHFKEWPRKTYFEIKEEKRLLTIKHKASFIIIFFTTFLHDKDTAIFSRFDEEQTLHIFYHVL